MTPDEITFRLFGNNGVPFAHSKVRRGYLPYRARDCVIAYGVWPVGALMILKRDRSYFCLFVNRFCANNAFSYSMENREAKKIAPILEEEGTIVDRAEFDKLMLRLTAEAI